MTPTRRQLLTSAAGLAATAAVQSTARAATPSRTRLAVSTYSYWHFKPPKTPCETVIEEAAAIGFEGVEILHRQMDDESPAYVNKLKRMAFERGLSLPMLSIHQDFVSPDAGERKKNVDHTKHCVELAVRLGIPAVRLNSGRWKTVKTFDDLMKVKGDEPPLKGYTNDDAFKWCVDSVNESLKTAEKEGVTLALENHWGLTTDVKMLLRIHKAVNSKWLGINLDTGNWPDDPYAGIAALAPHATIVQAKTYYGGGVWYTLDLDYKKIAGILKNAGYRGWVSLEMEGNGPASESVRKSYELLRSAFA